MNQTKFRIGDKVILKYSSNNGGKMMSVEKIRSNARGENEYQLSHLSKNDPLINHEWFNEENLAFSNDVKRNVL